MKNQTIADRKEPSRSSFLSSFKLRGLRVERGIILLLILFVPLLLASNPRIAATDETQYYVYLTSLRFDGDMDFRNDYTRLAEINPNAGIENLLSQDRIRPKTGLLGNIAPVGSAILWAPFFLLADIYVHIANLLGARIPVDHGFSKVYVRAVCYGSAVYGMLGLLLCYRLARRFSTQFASSLATAVIWLATPLVFYMFVQMAFAHANGFFLVALFLWLWLQERQAESGSQEPAAKGIGTWVALGLVGGLMTITREQLGLFLLLPAVEAAVQYAKLLFGIHSVRTEPVAQRFHAIGMLFLRHVLFLGVFLLTLTPQIATYQVLNGAPRPASEVGSKFIWCSPHFLDTLVDYNPAPSAWCPVEHDFTAAFPPFAHGAFLWSPILPLALLGLVLLWRRDRFLATMLFAAFLAQTYTNGAFGTTWHLTGSFGFRRLIECSPIFILGLAVGIDWANHVIDRRLLVMLAIGCIAWNFGLIVNWTVLNEKTKLRDGLSWPALFRWQFEVPGELLGKVRALVFDRCSLMKNGC